MKIYNSNFSLSAASINETKEKINTESPGMEPIGASCSAVIPKYFPFISRFMTPGVYIEPTGKFARITTGAQHDKAIMYPDWEADTKRLYDETIPALNNLSEKERKEYLDPIEEIRGPKDNYCYSAQREFRSTHNSKVHKEKKSELGEIVQKIENGSKEFHKTTLESSDYPFHTCNGVEEIRLNSHLNQKKWYEESIGYLDYQMSRPGFWKLPVTEITEVLKKTHKLIGKNYSKDPYLGKFRENMDSLVFEEQFNRTKELHGTLQAVRIYLGKEASESDIALVARAIDNPYKPHTPKERKIIQKFAFYPPPSTEVDGKMKELILNLKQMQENENNPDPIGLAVKAHHGLTEIHPFVDGNGRVARTFMNSILMNGGKTPPIFIDEKEYIKSIKQGEAAFRKTLEKGMERSETYYRASVLPTRPIGKPAPTLLDHYSSPSTQEAINYLETKQKENTKKIFSSVPPLQ